MMMVMSLAMIEIIIMIAMVKSVHPCQFILSTLILVPTTGIELSLMERLLPPICVALQHSKSYHKAPKSVPHPPTQEVALDITMEDLDRTGAAEELVLRTQGDKVAKAASTAVCISPP